MKRVHRDSAGFSLIEILVGLVIGMLGIIVMMQVFSISEERKRTTTGVGDAQNNAVVALDGLQRDIAQAGYGFASTKILNCNLLLTSGATVPLAPVIINPGVAVIPAGDANTDTLLVAYGNGNGQPEGHIVSSQSGAENTISATGLLAVGDLVVVAPDACAGTLRLTPVVATTAATVTVGTAAAGTNLFNFGAAPRFKAYAIRNGNLTVCDYGVDDCGEECAVAGTCSDAWVPIANNVVSLRAQYGHDTSVPMDAIVDAFNQTTPANACGWMKSVAVRLALVARSGQLDKEVVTAAAPVWVGSAGAAIDVSAAPDAAGGFNWQNYRYRVYETAVPIRNVSWKGVEAGC